MIRRQLDQWARRLLGPSVRAARRAAPVWSGLRLFQRIVRARRGYRFGRTLPRPAVEIRSENGVQQPNPLEVYFDGHHTGRGVWKWRHYFEVYHRHLAKFVGQDVGVVEIGVYSGGSLEMWKQYFGPQVRIYGVDIEEACRAYEDDVTRIFIGDQADRVFWRGFRSEVSSVDVVIDDGGHEPDQQIATFEALFPHMRPGAVYICEDVGGLHNPFVAYMSGLTRNLYSPGPSNSVTPFQAAVHGVYYYPGLVVVAKCDVARTSFVHEKHGTQWEPFLG